jgi:hypothetical protein
VRNQKKNIYYKIASDIKTLYCNESHAKLRREHGAISVEAFQKMGEGPTGDKIGGSFVDSFIVIQSSANLYKHYIVLK